MSEINGILNIYKEKGFTSHDIVAIIRKLLSVSKVGHTGTLDPAAEGVLPICIGRATKLSSFIMAESKSYLAECKLGIVTNTLDDTGDILQESEVRCGRDEIEAAVQSFKGNYLQTPPMYSAIKIGGKKLYELARKGETVEREKRECVIHDIKISEFIDEKTFGIDVSCSKGTYIRSLVSDIGQMLGCGAAMGGLIRYRSGDFGIETSIRLSQLREAAADRSDNSNSFEGLISKYLLPIESVLGSYIRVKVNQAYNIPLYNGHAIPAHFLEGIDHTELKPGTNVLAYDSMDSIVGVYTVSGKPDIKLNPLIMLKIKD